MKRLLFLLFVATIVVSCSNNEPVETSVAKTNVEISGNSFNSFKLCSDVRLFVSPDPNDNSKWAIKATVPIQKVDGNQFNDLSVNINLLDENNLKVRDGFILTGEDIDAILPVINSVEGAEKTIIFSANEGSKKDFSYKEAVEMLNKTKSITCSFNSERPVVEAATPEPEPEPEAPKSEKTYNDPPKTVHDLCMKYGIYGKMSQYDKALRNGEKKKAKRIEDDMYEICKKVKKDLNVPEWLAKNFKNYVEDREDEIEDKY